MVLYHGTAARLRPSIEQQGLKGGSDWPVFLARDKNIALRYARARAAAEMHAGRRPVGLIVGVIVDGADVKDDPFSVLEANQVSARGGVSPEQIVSMDEHDFGWVWWRPSLEMHKALAEHAAL